MSSGTIDLTVETYFPKIIKMDWLPHDGLSVAHLFQFTRYPPLEMVYYDHSNLSPLLHNQELTNFEPKTLCQFGPPSNKLIDKYKDGIRGATSPIHSFTLVPLSGDQVRFPVWVLDYWREIKRAMGYRASWKQALVWLNGISQSNSMAEACGQVMAGLLCFPWNGGNCTVKDMAVILTNS